MTTDRSQPLVSVLMPTYRQDAFIARALESLLAQTLDDWELVLVDDGSPDGTHGVVRRYLADGRIRYLRNVRNTGLGAVLNQATAVATGRYVAYLPSDDVYHADHLEALMDVLERRPETYLAYGGVQTGYSPTYEDPDWRRSATLRGDDVVGRELEALRHPPHPRWRDTLKSGNILALVQVAHGRSLESKCRWVERSQEVSDRLEAEHWRALLERGARFDYAGRVTCQWVQHSRQRHRIIGGTLNQYGRMSGGLAMYRAHYGIGKGTYLNWQPALGFRVDERRRSETAARNYPRRTSPPASGPALRILVVGDLSFNPERLLVLEHAGHRLAGLWLRTPSIWSATGPFPWGDIVDINPDGDWRRRVVEFAPDVVYAGTNWPAIPLVARVVRAGLGVPLVFHFKEGPGYALRYGLWPDLVEVLTRSDGQIFINDESREWFRLATGGAVGGPRGNHLVMDADLAPRAWFSDDFAEKLSARDGQLHTVCPGGWEGTFSWEELAEAQIHVHLYGEVFHDLGGGTVTAADLTRGYVHLHPTVDPHEWVAELSRYDAGWTHVFPSTNGGRLGEATWNDLNLPGRLPTYAAAGLPWIMRDNRTDGSVTALENLGRRYDVAIAIRSVADLAGALSDRERLRRLGDNMRQNRDDFTFDAHLDRLIDFLRGTISGSRRRAS